MTLKHFSRQAVLGRALASVVSSTAWPLDGLRCDGPVVGEPTYGTAPTNPTNITARMRTPPGYETGVVT